MVQDDTDIRDVTGEPAEPNAALVRRAFQTVADELGLTQERDPKFMAFMPAEQLEEMRERGATFYGLFRDGEQVGFAAVEREEHDEGEQWFLKRLAVLPDHREHGCARRLIERVIRHVREQGAKELHIGIINEQTRLKKWYQNMGFREYRRFEIPDLPFSVCLLSMNLDGKKRGKG